MLSSVSRSSACESALPNPEIPLLSSPNYDLECVDIAASLVGGRMVAAVT